MTHAGTRFAILVAFMVALPAASWSWEHANDITATPLIEGKPAAAEFKRHWPDFSPGAPMRDVRLKGPGRFTSFSLDDCERLGNDLIGRYGDLAVFRIAGKSFDQQPWYFADLRLFLVSIDPAVMAFVPQAFALKHPQADFRNHDLFNEVNAAYIAFDERGATPRPRSLSVHASHWLNNVEVSAVLPRVDGVELTSPLWPGRRSLQDALNDPRFPFTVVASERFPGFFAMQAK